MNAIEPPTPPALTFRRTFQALRPQVFAVFSQADLLRQWICPPGFTITEAELDLREGGHLRLTMRYPDGDKSQWMHAQAGLDYIASYGTFQQVRQPERLAYTWRHEGDVADEFIAIDFIERGHETDILFRHSGFANERSRREYEYGWVGAFDKVAAMLRQLDARGA